MAAVRLIRSLYSCTYRATPAAQQQCLLVGASNVSVASSALLLRALPHAAADAAAPDVAARSAKAAGAAGRRAGIRIGKTAGGDGGGAAGRGGLFATPPLGWNAWNAYHCDVSERLVVAMADAMISTGLVLELAYWYCTRVVADCSTRNPKAWIHSDVNASPRIDVIH